MSFIPEEAVTFSALDIDLVSCVVDFIQSKVSESSVVVMCVFSFSFQIDRVRSILLSSK